MINRGLPSIQSNMQTVQHVIAITMASKMKWVTNMRIEHVHQVDIRCHCIGMRILIGMVLKAILCSERGLKELTFEQPQ